MSTTCCVQSKPMQQIRRNVPHPWLLHLRKYLRWKIQHEFRYAGDGVHRRGKHDTNSKHRGIHDRLRKNHSFLHQAVQELAQFKKACEQTYSDIISNTTNWYVFGGVEPEEADYLAEILFRNFIDLTEPKLTRQPIFEVEETRLTTMRIPRRHRRIQAHRHQTARFLEASSYVKLAKSTRFPEAFPACAALPPL